MLQPVRHNPQASYLRGHDWGHHCNSPKLNPVKTSIPRVFLWTSAEFNDVLDSARKLLGHERRS